MADITNFDGRTTGANYIPEKWSDLVLHFREANLGAGKFFERRDKDITVGDKIHFPVPSTYTPFSYEDGDILQDHYEVNTDGEKTITIDQIPMSAFIVLDTLAKQAQYDKKAVDFKSAGYAVAKVIDTDILAEATNFTNTAIGTAGTALDNNDLIDAQKALDENDVPESDRAFFMAPRAIADLFKLSGNYFTSIDFTGERSLVSGELTQMLLGARVIKTTNVPDGASSSKETIYAHKSAIGVAMQKNIETQEQYDLDKQGTVCNVRAYYGVTTLRPDSGVIVHGS